MELNSKYKVNVKEVGELYRNIDSGQMILAPFYQRNFIWKLEDQVDFIETILRGYPCPEIFIAEGKIDLDTHIKYIHVIDGQQRLTTIKKFLSNELAVRNKFYKDLTTDEKEKVHSYEIGTITLKLDPENDIKEIEEIFRRLNKNKHSLNETEKTISLLSDNDFMLIARLLSGDLIIKNDEDLEENEAELFINNPFISDDLKQWSQDKNFETVYNFLDEKIYTPNQIKKNYPTKDIIDIISTVIKHEFHSRILEENKIIALTPAVYEQKDLLYYSFIDATKILSSIKYKKAKGVKKKHYFLTRGNMFSLYIALIFNIIAAKKINLEKLQTNLDNFCANLPKDYKEAARNSVMDRKQRTLRHNYLNEIILKSLD